ncbi:hypothetical protein QZH41_003783 [Actinostola sp. cb2023]|nr:hypothetical protein QZH41_003783 [Actinostola sp. cb2023]
MEFYVNAYSVPTICSPLSNQAVQLAVNNYPHLRGLELADIPSNSDNVEIDVLIGADYYWNFVTGAIKRGDRPGPVAMYTKMGWVLSGPVILSESQTNNDCSVQLNSTHILKVEADLVQMEKDEQFNMKEELKKFWDLESLGIRNDEISVYDKFTQSIQFDGRRYEAELPFKEEHPLLPDNQTPCVKRLNTLLTRLQGKHEILTEYDNIIKEQIKQGIVEPISDEGKESATPGIVHYLPHREVIRMDKETTKLRIVYDASAHSTGPSLNDCLYAGPSLSPLIFDILVRFRLNKIGMIADIEKAFLNISIKPEHRDYLRFLWVDDPFSDNAMLKHLRFTRVVFGVTSSPFILNATIRHHLNHYTETDPQFVKELLRSLYVDDYASGSNTSTSAFNLARKIKSTLTQGGFNMRKWMSNSKELMEMLEESEEFPEVTPTSDHQNLVVEEDQGYIQYQLPKVSATTPRVLGQIWEQDKDEFKYDLTKPLLNYDENMTPTKRTVLSITAKFYDPLGLIAPIILLFKLMFQ